MAIVLTLLLAALAVVPALVLALLLELLLLLEPQAATRSDSKRHDGHNADPS